ncbi:hypothetical protein CcCBS67573_g07081 [Chytriomyces confervae]|uniref:DNA-directed primase/polymerase protein n=1 Tax=Chytriomyces confervae TaxID=246404 RepID=A0A507EZ79_9FUNG|nr:hypothetical protein CcCBS67573_g07081 [Chytriomyces confervae]
MKAKFARTSGASFYGHNLVAQGHDEDDRGEERRKRRNAKPDSWLKLIENIRKQSIENNCFVVWRVFHRQETAFRAADTSLEPLRVFSYEIDVQRPGIRRFVISTVDGFWTKYCSMAPAERVYYEVIRENTPCKLYFDIEFSIDLNPGLDTHAMMVVFKERVIEELSDVFQLRINMQHILDLDSTTDVKFSRHLIFNIPNTAWRNNAHVGQFVHNLAHKLRTEHTMLQQLSEKTPEQQTRFNQISILFIKTSHDPSSLFIDEGVYSRNRNFRIVHSSKIGKHAFLRHYSTSPDSEFEMNPNEPGDFIASLVSITQWVPGTRLLNALNTVEISNSVSSTPKALIKPPASYGPDNVSAYPEIDAYVAQWIQQNTETASASKPTIKSVSNFSQDKILFYSVAGNRYCFNVQREHKSNGVYYVVDLKRGSFSQRCHDPECKHFMSRDVDLPLRMNPFASLSEDIDDEYDGLKEFGQATESNCADTFDAIWDEIPDDEILRLEF